MPETYSTSKISPLRSVHSWLRKIAIAHIPGPSTPVLDVAITRLIDRFKKNGHTILPFPGVLNGVDVLLTSARFGEPLRWRDSLQLTARRRFQLEHVPTVFTLLQITSSEWDRMIEHFSQALAKSPLDPADFNFPGLVPQAYHTLYEQGRRGGPILAVARLIQSQAMSIRNIVVIGDDEPQFAYTFDLVGAHPRSDATEGEAFYDDLMNRILTAVSTHEITEHEIIAEEVPFALWQSLETPRSMKIAGRELGLLGFFTEMVKVGNLVDVPAVNEAIASQYSEGCFATWEPKINALVCTITGSARPVVKDMLTDDELAIITGVRPDGKGAFIRHVEGKKNDPPSSEAVEMMRMDEGLPWITLGKEWPVSGEAPVARSKLHGHRGVSAYDPRFVEFVRLDPPYYDYPVSCSTEAQAHAIQTAFARSEALRNSEDPRQVIFTVLPGHGVFIVEKWTPGKMPFQIIEECMVNGRLNIVNEIPQGPFEFQPGKGSRMVLRG